MDDFIKFILALPEKIIPAISSLKKWEKDHTKKLIRSILTFAAWEKNFPSSSQTIHFF